VTEDLETMPEAAAPPRLSRPSVFGWLVRRELWEHRAVWVAPLAVAAFAALIHVISAATIPAAERAEALAPGQGWRFQAVYAMVAIAALVTSQMVGLLYSLDAMQSERRDRSVLFWRSLPVSDRMTVAAKAFVPMVILPVVGLAFAIVANLVTLLLQSAIWHLGGYDAGELWARLDLPGLWLALLLSLPFMMLWNAPLYAWLLAVSAWARRVAVLWAAAPFVAVLLVEHTALHKSAVHWMVERRIGGGILEPLTVPGHAGHGDLAWIRSFADIDFARLYALPGLWIGAALAVLLLMAAARLRRTRAPL